MKKPRSRPNPEDKNRLNINDLLKDVRDKGQEFLEEGLETAKESFEDGSDALKKTFKGFENKTVKDISSDLKTTIKKHPLASILAAVGLGFLIGQVFKSDK